MGIDRSAFMWYHVYSSEGNRSLLKEVMNMTERERFEAAMMRRGYEISRLGLITILRHGDYTAMWFFKADDSRNKAERPTWSIG